ncbi:MAG TPA: hypothetical protein DCL15_11640 [Chloroflexi bacterium]|nr:hypothetical protein [Chloroflexota bacterium]HHW84966.1 hypothetical protein [Chloroflexota bacterium]
MKGTIFTSEMLAEQAQRYVVENGYSDAEAVIEEMLERELTDGAACESLDGCASVNPTATVVTAGRRGWSTRG